MQRFCVLDYETRSEVDLKEVGAFEYANHPTTEILCVAWGVGTEAELRSGKTEIFSWSPGLTKTPPWELFEAMSEPNTMLVAHNAFFEQVITRFVLGRYFSKPPMTIDPPVESWICTAAQAAALALPRNLEGACLALNLPVKKDMEGRRLILKYCKPRKITKNNPNKWHNSKADLLRLVEYCKQDVRAEISLFLNTPRLNPKERKVWELDQKINWRGFEVDRPLVQKIQGMIAVELENLNKELSEITGGEVTSANQRAKLLAWVQSNGLYQVEGFVNADGLNVVDNLQAKTLRDLFKLNKFPNKKVKRVLEIRRDASKTSTAKYDAFEARSRTDGRVRDNLVYHTASTGRWGGAGVQPQNFPRGSIKNSVQAAEICREHDLEMVRLIYGNPMDTFASCLRPMIRAGDEKVFLCADYAAIEARVLFWVAKHEKGLDAFRNGRPIYEEMAQAIWNHPSLSEVTKEEREVGKRAILGCGYGMGWEKFKATCDLHGDIQISDETAQLAVQAYRSTHAQVPALWKVLERAAIHAVKTGKKVTVNRTSWFVKDKFLFCELPSGRRLAYYGPEIKIEITKWKEKRPVLYHWGVDSLSKKWVFAGTYGGKLTENVVQAVARDLMAEAMLRIEGPRFEVVLSVHDELLAERVDGKATIEEFEKLMAEVPAWGAGLPVKVSGWAGERYRK